MEQQYHGVGRRKTSVARVWMKPGSGEWKVNGRTAEDYFPRHSLLQHAQEPVIATELQTQFDIKVNVSGGGQTGQAGAVRLGVARALLMYDAELRGKLRERGLLTRDPREVERKKPGRPGARKRFQFSKR
ncbi:MAG TPA: 30S ribosomal protein S9 [Longimicrobiales bacterium]|jgi:small subunit ribosomal protein S9|nr:30S ribosomal protein S9 [Longimicrobiales bacterium]